MRSGHEIRARLDLPLDRYTLSVDLELDRHVTAIFGISGSGKTSLLETIAGIRRGARGELRLGDEVWQDSERGLFVPPERRDIGYVPQDGLLFPHRDVYANLCIGQYRAQRQGQDVEALKAEVIELLELEPLLKRRVDTLSGGERQRVALGRALCSGPRLLMMDEPLAALDMGLRRRLLSFLRRIRQSFDIPMLLVSHDPIEVQALCDDMVMLHDGEVIAQGDPVNTLMQASRDAVELAHLVENVIPCRFDRYQGEEILVHIGNGTGGLQLSLPRDGEVDDGSQMVAVHSQDIILSTSRPSGLSARNVLPGRVLRVAPAGRNHLAICALDHTSIELAVEVTKASLQELELTPGTPVFLIIKASALQLF